MEKARIKDLSFQQRLEIYALKNSLGMSYRAIEARVEIPKSTIHYNFSKICAEVDEYEKSRDINGKRFLVHLVLTCVFDCQMSIRAVSRLIKSIWQTEISHQTIQRILYQCSFLALSKNSRTENGCDFKQCLADEIFYKNRTILGVTEPHSGLCFLEFSFGASGKSWEMFLQNLTNRGFKPNYYIGDGGQGMKRGFGQVFPNSKHIRDSFHILFYLGKAERAMLGQCYNLMDQLAKAEMNRKHSKKSIKLRSKSCLAEEIYDDFYLLLRELRESFYLSDPSQIGRYIGLNKLLEVVKHIESKLKEFYSECGNLPAVYRAFTYIENCEDHIALYKKTIECELRKHFSPRERRICQNFFITLIDFIMQRERTYESKKRYAYWDLRVSRLKNLIQTYLIKDEKRYAFLFSVCEKICKSISKSSSLMESVNAVLRRHIRIHKNIPEWFPRIFVEFWNNRKFQRGKRKGFSPMELYTGKSQSGEWLDDLVRRYPYYDLRASLPPFPKFKPTFRWKRADLSEIYKHDQHYLAYRRKEAKAKIEKIMATVA